MNGKVLERMGIELVKKDPSISLSEDEVELYYDLVPFELKKKLFDIKDKKFSFHYSVIFLGFFIRNGCYKDFVEIPYEEIDLKIFNKKGKYVDTVRNLIKYGFLLREKKNSVSAYSYKVNLVELEEEPEIIFPFKKESSIFNSEKEVFITDKKYEKIKNFLDTLINIIKIENFVSYDENNNWYVISYNFFNALGLLINFDDVIGKGITKEYIAFAIIYIKIYAKNAEKVNKVFLQDHNKQLHEFKVSEFKGLPDEIQKYIGSRIRNMDYHSEFLKSLYWKSITQMIRENAHNKCQVCGGINKKLNIHHNTYEHHGFEVSHLEDLVCLCEDCHHLFHEKQKLYKNNRQSDNLEINGEKELAMAESAV